MDGKKLIRSRQVQGAFCAAHVNETENHLTLVNDKLGQRTIYYYIGEEFIVFSSAFRILEKLKCIKKTMNFRAVCELKSFNCTLNDRTIYNEIRSLGPGQVLQVKPDGTKNYLQYWDWTEIRQTSLSIQDAAEKSHQLFIQAVERRTQKEEKNVAAFLSGGMDSRLIVSILRQLEKK